MKNLIKDLLYSIVKNFPNNHGVVLMYHSISADNRFFSVKPDSFFQQMEYLYKARYKVISLEQAKLNIVNKQLEPKTVVITFDDGYLDNYQNAWPILSKFNFPATIFVNTALLEKNNDNELMDVETIKKLYQTGLISFGSHGCNHLKLTKLNNQEIEKEFRDSKMFLDEKLSIKTSAVAYPYGNYNQTVQRIADKYYSIICTVNKGKICNQTKLTEIPRNSIDSEVSLQQFKGIVNYGRL